MNMRHLAVAGLLAATATAAQQPFQLDPSFRVTAIQQQAIGDALERPDGKVIVSGWMYDPAATTYRLGNLLNPDGSLVPRPVGQNLWYGYMGGKIVPWGQDMFYVGNGQGLTRYWLDGTWDSTYQVPPDPRLGGGQGGDFHVFMDGRVLVSGNFQLNDTANGFTGPGFGLIWLNSDGSLDTTRIHRYIGQGSTITRLRELSDGKILCGGRLLQFEGEQVPSIVYRVLPDGSMDSTFHGPTTTYGYVKYFMEQPDGKILMTGRFSFEGSPDTLGLVRLLPNGQLDPSFNNYHQFRATYRWGQMALVRQTAAIGANMLAVTGDFDRVDGEVHGGIVMLDNSGTILPEYFQGSGCGGFFSTPNPEQIPNQFIVGIKPAQDGGYFIYGAYRGYDDGTTNDPSQRLISKLYGLNVGINEQQPSPMQTLQIAPNPSAGSTVLSTGAAMANAELVVHDASGRVVWQAAWPAGAEQYRLPAGVLAPGAYVVRVASGLRGPQPPQPQGSSATAAVAIVYTGRLVVLP
ncbi:MAG: T9SS type A sorting domain-containing protein [Flavobacteriales bacterium]|nr:T9SS type A sorting domain-containing protein [Flavobacteriales bacterium]